MNSTLKSLLFWAALVVIAVVVYNVSTKLQNTDHQINFSEFMSAVKTGGVESVIITGQEITGTNKEHETFHTYAPAQYEGLANELLAGGVVVKAKAETASPWASISVVARASFNGPTAAIVSPLMPKSPLKGAEPLPL